MYTIWMGCVEKKTGKANGWSWRWYATPYGLVKWLRYSIMPIHETHKYNSDNQTKKKEHQIQSLTEKWIIVMSKKWWFCEKCVQSQWESTALCVCVYLSQKMLRIFQSAWFVDKMCAICIFFTPFPPNFLLLFYL